MTTPALIDSPRSTRGTTRTTTYSKGYLVIVGAPASRGGAFVSAVLGDGRVEIRQPARSGVEACREVRDIGRAHRFALRGFGDERRRSPGTRWPAPRCPWPQGRVGGTDAPRSQGCRGTPFTSLAVFNTQLEQ